MSGITVAVAESHLQTWLDAEAKVAAGQSASHNGRSLSFADLGDILNQIKYWEQRVLSLSRGGSPSVSRITLHG